MNDLPDRTIAPPLTIDSPSAVLRSHKWLRRVKAVFVSLLVLLVICYFIIFPLIGLFTGHLLLIGRSGGTDWVEGPWARIISAALLLIPGYFFYFVQKSRGNSRLADKLPIWQKE